MFIKMPLSYRYLSLIEAGDAGDPPAGGSGDAGDPPAEKEKKPAEKGKVNEHGFPDETKVSEMTAEQQAAYWKHQNRKAEDKLKTTVPKSEYDKVHSDLEAARRATLSDADKAKEDETKAAEQKGYRTAVQKFGHKLVRSEMRAAVKGRVSDEKLNTLLEPVDLSKFISEDGEVLTAKVASYAEGIAPEQPNHRGWESGSSGERETSRYGTNSVAAAREEHREKLRAKTKK